MATVAAVAAVAAKRAAVAAKRAAVAAVAAAGKAVVAVERATVAAVNAIVTVELAVFIAGPPSVHALMKGLFSVRPALYSGKLISGRICWGSPS